MEEDFYSARLTNDLDECARLEQLICKNLRIKPSNNENESNVELNKINKFNTNQQQQQHQHKRVQQSDRIEAGGNENEQNEEEKENLQKQNQILSSSSWSSASLEIEENDQQLIYETVRKIKNLIIGNNKFKSIYLNTKLMNRLIELSWSLIDVVLDSHPSQQQATKSTLLNELVICMASFACGQIQHVQRLIQVFHLHKLIIKLLKKVHSQMALVNKSKQGEQLIESAVRCLSNLYSCAQMVPSLVLTLNQSVFFAEEMGEQEPQLMQVLMEIFDVYVQNQNLKQTILNIVLLSIQTNVNLNQLDKLEPIRQQLHRFEVTKRLASILTSLNEKCQANILKFYASISFESTQSTQWLEETNYYDYNLIDLLSTYLSRENSAHLQLLSAKCLTNMCRSAILNEHEMQVNSKSSLIRVSALPTLVRLCFVKSLQYRDYLFSSTSVTTSSVANTNTNNNNHSQLNEQSLHNYTNIILLIDAINSLTYLVELNVDLQLICSHLEQIINVLCSNIINTFNYRADLFDMDNLRISEHVSRSSSQRSLDLGSSTSKITVQKSKLNSLYSYFYLNHSHFGQLSTQYVHNRHQYPPSETGAFESTQFLSDFERNLHRRLVSVCFQALAVLASNNEQTRRSISDNGELMSHLVECVQLSDEERLRLDSNLFSSQTLVDSWDLDSSSREQDSNLLRLSSLYLLHSLSRSVQQLRTKFLDEKLWLPLIDIIKRIRYRKLKRAEFNGKDRLLLHELKHHTKHSSGEHDELMSDEAIESSRELAEAPVSHMDAQIMMIDADEEASQFDGNLNEFYLIKLSLAIVANLLLEFSPSKERMMENGIITILIDLLEYNDNSIRINCMWALMNLAYKADQQTKQQILNEVKIERLFHLLTEQDEILVMKTLGLIRNLICYKAHIDQIMSLCGQRVIQAIVMILESDFYSLQIKEQALCILANVADGSTTKEYLINNEDLLRKINSFMTHNCVELQVASVNCIQNLVNSSDDGALERQFKLKEIGAHRILQKLLHSNDVNLFEKVKLALQQFSSTSSSSSFGSSTLSSNSTSYLQSNS